ncbi:hypothetical protein NGM37_60730, partial [Streptomyces sp. TRM76130]|nr:hypothetical protein [Streptomyces sp. TRM76130]
MPWIASAPIGAPTPVRAVDGTLWGAVTHNQASDSTTVTHIVQTTSAQRSNEPSDPVEFTTHWRVRVDAPAATTPPAATSPAGATAAPAPDGWGTPRAHGPTT